MCCHCIFQTISVYVVTKLKGKTHYKAFSLFTFNSCPVSKSYFFFCLFHPGLFPPTSSSGVILFVHVIATSANFMHHFVLKYIDF